MSFNLDPQTWARVAPLLDQAFDIDPSERERWFDQLTIDQPDIAETVRTLLAEHEELEAENFLGQSFAPAASAPSLVGKTIGAYSIESLLGRGGMGEVWLAKRSDGRFKGQFAVKFLDSGLAAASVADRFMREGRLLARLTHPNIARLIDAGVMPEGRPYLVLEYVEGDRIDRFCDTRSLDIEARVRLFINVLAAVAHAHSHLIVHRDIKPSNVLVTPAFQVKLLDFGIAKLIGTDISAEDDSAPTRIEELVLTPDFAAPEQILGEPASTTTDVYQLGVLLYVLLTGRLPLAAGVTRSERVKAALEDQAPRASDVVSALQRKQLRGDLDAIVAKALRKRPDERYATVAAFAEDLRRFLDHQPVNAREGALAYRARKFIRRNRGAVAGTAVAIAALLVAASFALIQMREAQVQRDQSRFNEKRAQAQNQFMALMMSTVGTGGHPVTPGQILDKAVVMLDKQYADDPAFRVDMLIQIGDRFEDIGDTEKDYAALVRAEGIAKQLHSPALIANVECEAARVELAMGHIDRSAARVAEGHAALERVSDPTQSDSIGCQEAQALLTEAQGNPPAAIRLMENAIASFERTGEADQQLYVDLLSNTAEMYAAIGDPRKAFEYMQRNAAALERMGYSDTESGIAVSHNIASNLMNFGEIRAALTQEQEVVSLAKAASTDGSIHPAVSTAYGNLQLRMEQPQMAMVSFDAALAESKHNADLPAELFARSGRARALLALSHSAESEAELAEITRLAKGQETANRRPLARAHITQAEVLLAQNRPEEARQQIESTLKGLREATTGGSSYLGFALIASSRIAAAQGRFADADSSATEALEVFTKTARNPELSADVGEALLLIAEARRGRGDSSGARDAAGRAVVSLYAGLGPEHSLTRAAVTFANSPASAPIVSERADQATPRSDSNSMLAHELLLKKRQQGQIDAYFLGDSITRRWGAADPRYRDLLENWNHNFRGWNAADFGWGGDKTENILWRIEQGELDGVNPKVIVLMAGTNNVGSVPPVDSGDSRVADIVRGVRAIVEECRRRAPKAILVLMAITPRNDNMGVMPTINRINEALAGIADGVSIRFLNINAQLADKDGRLYPGMTGEDNLHLTAKAYQIWANALRPVLTELLGQRGGVDRAPPPTADPGAR